MPNVFTRSAFSDSAYKGVPNPTEPSVGTSVAYLFDLTPNIKPWLAISLRRLTGDVCAAPFSFIHRDNGPNLNTDRAVPFNENGDIDMGVVKGVYLIHPNGVSVAGESVNGIIKGVKDQGTNRVISGATNNTSPVCRANQDGFVSWTANGGTWSMGTIQFPSGPYTIFSVFQLTSIAPTGTPYLFGNNIISTRGIGLRFTGSSFANRVQFYGNGSDNARRPVLNCTAKQDGGTLVDGSFHTFVAKVSPKDMFMRLDNVNLSVNVVLSGVVSADTGAAGILSNAGATGNTVPDLRLRELIIYTGTTLTNAQVSAVESNIRQYWGTP